MDKHAKTKSFWKGKGFYIALALITAGAALASFFAITAMLDSIGSNKDKAQSTIPQEDITWGLDGKDVNKAENASSKPPYGSSTGSNTASSPSASSGAQSAQSEPAALQPAQTPSFVSPMSGNTLQAFSGDELVFNQTMQDWRTHDGMDITGSVNMGVHAPTTATVAAVYDDARWGGVVELTAGKLTMRLCGVKDIRVKAGDAVQTGDTVGQLGEIPAESKLETHLHVEFIEDGKNVNPADYFA